MTWRHGLLLAAVSLTAASAQGRIIGYVATVRGGWTLDGENIRPNDAMRPVLDGSVIAHAAGVRDDRDSIAVRIGGRVVTFSCARNDCETTHTIRAEPTDAPSSEALTLALEALRDPTIRSLASEEAVLSDDFRIVDGIVRVSNGSVELRPLVVGELERGLVALACRANEPECSPERAGALLCLLLPAGCRLSIPAEGVYRISLYRRFTANGATRYETTEGTPAFVLAASGARYDQAVAQWAAVDAEMRRWPVPPRANERPWIRRALLLRGELKR